MDPRIYLVSPIGEIHLPTGIEKELFNKHLEFHENITGFNQFAENNADGTRARAGEHFIGGDSVRVNVWDANLAATFENQDIHNDELCMAAGEDILNVNCLDYLLSFEHMKHLSWVSKKLFRLLILPQTHQKWSKFLMEAVKSRMHNLPAGIYYAYQTLVVAVRQGQRSPD